MQRNAPRPDDHGPASLPTLLLLFGGVLLGALDIAIVGPALPAIQAEIGLDARRSAEIFSIYILFALIGAPLLASLSDRFGRRLVYTACLLLFGVGSLVVATATTLEVLLTGRAVQALGAGGTLPVASAVIADTFPEGRRGRALGLIGAVFGLAFVLGPLIGGIVLQWSWRWLFVINLPLVVVLVGLSLALLDDRKPSAALRFDWLGAGALALALAALTVAAGRLELNRIGIPLPGSMSGLAFAVSFVALMLFWRAEHRTPTPIVKPELLASRQMRVVGMLALATGLVEASMVFLPTLAVEALGVSASRASFMLLPLIAALIVGSIVAGRLVDRFGTRPIIQAGMTCTVAGLGLFALLPLAPASFYAAGLTVGLGLASLLGAPLRLAALEEGGAEGRGASQGLLTVCLGAGRLFGASLTGGVAASAGVAIAGYRRAMLVIAVGCCIALVASLGLRRRVAPVVADDRHQGTDTLVE